MPRLRRACPPIQVRWPGRPAPRIRRPRRGQALVEVSLIAVLLLVLGAGVFELGRALLAYTTVTHAARDGARAAVGKERSAAEIADAARKAAAPLLLSSVAVSPPTTSAADAQRTVTVTAQFDTPVPLISTLWGGGSLMIRRTLVAHVDQD